MAGMAEQASASYWIAKQDANGVVNAYMWDCHVCPALGTETSESDVVAAMNDHVAKAHSEHDYVAPPIPE